MACPNEENVPLRGKKKVIVRYVTVLQWLPNYTKMQAVSDVVAGITIGLTMIPQSIAYAALAGLTAQYGLYSSFLGGFIYLIFGTVKEVSIGPSSLMALLTINYTRDMPTDFVILLTFLAGCVELIMGLLNLGFIVDFISIPVTSGFTSATSVIIIIAQLQALLGLKYKSKNIIDNLMKLFENLENIRVYDAILGFSSIVLLLLLRKLQYLNSSRSNDNENNRIQTVVTRMLWFISISRNALVILICFFISVNMNYLGKNPFILSGQVESGFPRVSPPPFSSQVGNKTYNFLDMCSHLESGIIVVPLIAVLANVAIAKAFAVNSGVNTSQEMRTLGLCNILGSFVSSMPTCGAFTRSAVSNASGIQTPMAGLYTGTMALLALTFLTPYFYFIPRATLAAVLICAVMFMIDFKIIPILWKGSRVDAAATISTFIVSLLLSVEIGLLVGVCVNMIYLLYLSARPNIEVSKCKTILGDDYLMVTPDIGLFYPAVDFVNERIFKISEKSSNRDLPLVVDCGKFKGIDYTAVKGIERLLNKFEGSNKQLWFLNASPTIVNNIKKLNVNKPFTLIDSTENIVEYFENKRHLPEFNRCVTMPLLLKMQEKNGIESGNEDETSVQETGTPTFNAE